MTTSDREALLQIERGFWSVGDPSYYRQHMADDGMCLLPVGLLGKADTIESMRSAPPWSRCEMQDVGVRRLSGEVSMLTYRATAERAGGAPYHALVCSLYRRSSSEGWQLFLHQQTPLLG